MLDGKVALITGAASGQGRAASVLFAEHGASIAVVDINDEGAAETVSMVESVGTKAVAIHADVSVREDCDRMVAECASAFGRLDVLYNNAAVQMSGRLVECTEDDWDRTIATNLTAVFWTCRAALPVMLEGDGGSIISTASVLGLIGSEGYVAYGAAKAGLVALDPADRGGVRADGAGQRHRTRVDRHAALPQGGRGDGRSGRLPSRAWHG